MTEPKKPKPDDKPIGLDERGDDHSRRLCARDELGGLRRTMTAFEQLALDLGPAPQTTRAFKPKALRDCPFCGRPVNVLMGGSIHCGTCRALVIIAGTSDDIISTWNKRRK